MTPAFLAALEGAPECCAARLRAAAEGTRGLKALLAPRDSMARRSLSSPPASSYRRCQGAAR
jgi:hypothetical protein